MRTKEEKRNYSGGWLLPATLGVIVILLTAPVLSAQVPVLPKKTNNDPSPLDDTTYYIVVKVGWNLVSIPCDEAIEKTALTVRYDSQDYTWAQAVRDTLVLDTLYDWVRTTQQYASTSVTTLQPGTGYWLWAYVDCELVLTSDAEFLGHITDLKAGWNIMGTPTNDIIDPTLLTVTCNDHDYTWAEALANDIVLGFLYGWDQTNQHFMLSIEYEPGDGYWMYAYHDCVLTQ